MEEIQKGQKYKTESDRDFHAGTNLIVLDITGQNSDDLVYFKAESPKKDERKKGHKRYNNFNCRVWWVKDFCIKVD
jgi:hypothetical protein